MSLFLAYGGEFVLIGTIIAIAFMWSVSLFFIRRDVGRTAQSVASIAESLTAIRDVLDSRIKQ